MKTNRINHYINGVYNSGHHNNKESPKILSLFLLRVLLV